MSKAFTIIEVIFVIIIIGILAVIALPRFGETVESAHLAKIQHFVDLLNRSVGPNMWSGILRTTPSARGSVTHPDVAGIPKYSSIYDIYTNTADKENAHIKLLPDEISLNADGVSNRGKIHDIPLNNCADANSTPGIGVGRIASAKIGNIIYNIGCIDGSIAVSPHFFIDDGRQIISK